MHPLSLFCFIPNVLCSSTVPPQRQLQSGQFYNLSLYRNLEAAPVLESGHISEDAVYVKLSGQKGNRI